MVVEIAADPNSLSPFKLSLVCPACHLSESGAAVDGRVNQIWQITRRFQSKDDACKFSVDHLHLYCSRCAFAWKMFVGWDA